MWQPRRFAKLQAPKDQDKAKKPHKKKSNLDVDWTGKTSQMGKPNWMHQISMQTSRYSQKSKSIAEHQLVSSGPNGLYITRTKLSNEFKEPLRMFLVHLARQDPWYWLTST